MIRLLCWITFWTFIVGAVFAACGAEDDDSSDDSESGDDDADDDTGVQDDASDDVQPEETDPIAECEKFEEEEAFTACRDCVIQCNFALRSLYDLSAGPCLSEAIIPGWACDIVHSPRQDADDLTANQCVQYPSISPHLIEVTPDCHFTQMY